MKRILPLLLLLLALLWTPGLGAQILETPDFIVKGTIRLWGGDVALGYRGWSPWPTVDTILWASLGGGYQSANFFPGEDDSDPEDGISYKNLNSDWRLGISQGILYHPSQEKNLLELVLLYRGKYQYYLDNEDIPTEYPDREGILQNSLVGGLVLDNVMYDRAAMVKQGIYSSLSLEYAPKYFWNDRLGDTQFTRLTALGLAYQKLYAGSLLCVYLADRLIFDYLFGRDEEIPISARTTFGGLTFVPIHSNPGSYRGLGGGIRGIKTDRFDGFVKILNNLELRIYAPGLKSLGLLVPGLAIFLDGGIYDRLSRKLELSSLHLSCGAGLILQTLTVDLIGYLYYHINEQRFSLSFSQGLHY